MKFNIYSLILFVFIFLSCKEKSVLNTTFNCFNLSTNTDQKELTDIKKNFKISVPKNWKTELFYDEFQSSLFTADTAKQLSETFILDISSKSGELLFNDDFLNKIKSNSELRIINSKFENFKNIPSFWHLSSGKKIIWNLIV